MAYRLGIFFKTGSNFWLNLQNLVDAQEVEVKYSNTHLNIPTFEDILGMVVSF